MFVRESVLIFVVMLYVGRGFRHSRVYHRQTRRLAAGSGLIKDAVAWCGLNGLMYTDGNLTWSHAPVTLVPSTFPQSSFQYVEQMQPLINRMVDKIARDREFLTRCLEPVAESDDFVKRLLGLYQSLPESTVARGVNLGIHRSDYMLNDDPQSGALSTSSSFVPLQIEINTIASSFGCLSQRVGQLHRHVLGRFAQSEELLSLLGAVEFPPALLADPQSASFSSPENASIRSLATALALGHFLSGDSNAVIAFIVQPKERNQADQRLLALELWNVHKIRTEFLTLEEMHRMTHVDPEDGSLRLRLPGEMSDKTVAVAYYRAGYSPDDYPSEKEWEARSRIERSSAIKCPSVGYQLAGTKRVQQELCLPGVVEHFLGDAGDASKLRRCFAAQYSMQGLGTSGQSAGADVGTLAAIDSAARDGSCWVLKPQREGGGNNLYGTALSQFLASNRATPAALASFVLMQRIFPKPRLAAFLRQGELKILPSISELGIYGTFMGDGEAEPLLNEVAGYLLRTKPVGVDEGGVATGYSVLSSVVLTNE